MKKFTPFSLSFQICNCYGSKLKCGGEAGMIENWIIEWQMKDGFKHSALMCREMAWKLYFKLIRDPNRLSVSTRLVHKK